MAMRMAALSLAVGIMVVSAGPVLGDDVIVPTWRDDPGTTYQQWLFPTSADPAEPDVSVNPYGTATADISIGWAGEGWQGEFPPDIGRTGVWDLGRGVDAGHPELFGGITLDIPNRLLTDPLSYKEIWVQVTYYKDINDAPGVNVLGATYLGGETRVVETIAGWGEYRLYQTMWRIEPNPDHEMIVITSAFNGSLIDQIVVDTICVPEPASMLLMLGGGLTLVMRRRKAASCRTGCDHGRAR